jgi:hypothetical protein
MKAYPYSIDNGESVRGEKGMDLRDYFAAKAMQGLLASEEFLVTTKADKAIRCVAEAAYAIADAMMEAREQ